jgi:hypothetical protein
VPQTASPARLAPAAKKPRQILYVLVNNGTDASYVALYDAYAKSPTLIGKITKGLANPGAIWTDSKGDIFVGNDMTYASSVTEYAPRTYRLIRTYTNSIDLPFGGMVDSTGTMYVSIAGIKGRTEGGIAVFPPGKTSPSTIFTDNVYVPHGLAKDSAGHLFLAQIYGLQSSVLEFPKATNKSKVLPLDDLNTGAFLEDLKLDAHNDIVVADEVAGRWIDSTAKRYISGVERLDRTVSSVYVLEDVVAVRNENVAVIVGAKVIAFNIESADQLPVRVREHINVVSGGDVKQVVAFRLRQHPRLATYGAHSDRALLRHCAHRADRRLHVILTLSKGAASRKHCRGHANAWRYAAKTQAPHLPSSSVRGRHGAQRRFGLARMSPRSRAERHGRLSRRIPGW